MRNSYFNYNFYEIYSVTIWHLKETVQLAFNILFKIVYFLEHPNIYFGMFRIDCITCESHMAVFWYLGLKQRHFGRI